MEIGLSHTSKLFVDESLTAEAMGSGDMPVLATPALVALMENAAMLSVKNVLSDDETTVGGRIDITHLKPTKIGNEVLATAELICVEGRKLTFQVVAYQGETLIGKGEHIRFVVNRRHFLENL